MLNVFAIFSVGFILYLIATYKPTEIKYMSKEKSEALEFISNVIAAKQKNKASPELITKAIELTKKYNKQYELKMLLK